MVQFLNENIFHYIDEWNDEERQENLPINFKIWF